MAARKRKTLSSIQTELMGIALALGVMDQASTKNDFIVGFALACSEIHRKISETSSIAAVIREAGLNVAIIKKANVPSTLNMKEIYKILGKPKRTRRKS